MKSLLLPLAIFSSALLFAQEVITKDIIRINTKEKNAKTILFVSHTTNQDSYYIINASNETSKDFSKCKWTSRLSENEFKYFVDELTNIELGSTFECSLFKLRYKKEKINIKFNNTKCISEHKTFYFQESCNRALTFVLYKNQLESVNTRLNNVIDEQLAKK
jgi:hypothetical protein